MKRFLVGIALTIVSLGMTQPAFAGGSYCEGYCGTTVPTTQPTTTTTPTTLPTTTTTQATTTTVPKTTTTIPPFCNPASGQCLNIDPTTTTSTTVPASTTTTVGSTTVPAVTTTVGPPEAPTTTVAVAAEAQADTLPVTGGNTWWLVLFGVCMLGLGGCFLLWRRV